MSLLKDYISQKHFSIIDPSAHSKNPIFVVISGTNENTSVYPTTTKPTECQNMIKRLSPRLLLDIETHAQIQ